MTDQTPPHTSRPPLRIWVRASVEELVASANFASFEPGGTLTAAQQRALPDAIEVCRLSGVPDSKLGLCIAAYEHHYGTEWRTHFWRHRLRRAAANTDRSDSPSGAPLLPELVGDAVGGVAGSGRRSPNR